jgi:hypothetical protein
MMSDDAVRIVREVTDLLVAKARIEELEQTLHELGDAYIGELQARIEELEEMLYELCFHPSRGALERAQKMVARTIIDEPQVQPDQDHGSWLPEHAIPEGTEP